MIGLHESLSPLFDQYKGTHFCRPNVSFHSCCEFKVRMSVSVLEASILEHLSPSSSSAFSPLLPQYPLSLKEV